MVSAASSTAKQTGTRWGLPARSTVARRATLACAKRCLASCSLIRTALSLAGGLLDEVDRLVDPVAVGAVAEDGDTQGVSVPDGGAREEDPSAGVDLVENAGAVRVVEGHDRQFGFPGQLEFL